MQNVTGQLTKLQTLRGEEWVFHTYGKEFCFEKTSDGNQRILITTPIGYVDLLLTLATALQEPFFILYVLVLSRKAENLAARYQSKEVSRAELQTFLEKFAPFFENDARHHIWIFSPACSVTLVYDNHNVVYAYGLLETFSTILQNNGFKLIEMPKIPVPHGHFYHKEFDASENDVIRYWQWTQYPLKPQDEPR